MSYGCVIINNNSILIRYFSSSLTNAEFHPFVYLPVVRRSFTKMKKVKSERREQTRVKVLLKSII